MQSKHPSSAQARIFAGCLVLALMTGLAACSDSAVDTTAEDPVSAAASVANPNMDLVQAASVGTSNAPVRLAFELLGKPEVGTDIAVRLVVTPTVAVDQIRVSIEAPDGIELRDDSVYLQVGKSEAGRPHEHKFVVRTKAPGVLLLSAAVTVDKDDISTASHFAMPIITAAQP